jgi:predicted nucleic acid-binding protein
MKNITLSADEDLIERARLIARRQHRTLSEAFREWLAQFAQARCDLLFTEDLQHGQRFGTLQVRNPFL